MEGFRYSADMVEKGAAGLVWIGEALRGYTANPKRIVPKGNMAFAGLRNEQQVSDVIAYLQKASVEP
jgi:cytochrome c